jgi:hypothetical protein
MGKVTYAPGIEYVQGALAKPKKKDGHKCGDYLIGTHRTAATTNPNCTRIYLRKADSYERSTPVTTNEVKQRNRFSAVAAAVAARAKDLMKISADQAAFAAQKDQPDGVKTMKAYLWSLEKAAYDAEHQG